MKVTGKSGKSYHIRRDKNGTHPPERSYKLLNSDGTETAYGWTGSIEEFKTDIEKTL